MLDLIVRHPGCFSSSLFSASAVDQKAELNRHCSIFSFRSRHYCVVSPRMDFAKTMQPETVEPKAQSHSSGTIQKFELANGLRLLVKEDHRLPFVEIRAVLRGGVLAENPANNGVTLLMAKMLLQGTTSRTAEQIASEMESLGGSIDSYTGNNSFGVNAEGLSKDFS